MEFCCLAVQESVPRRISQAISLDVSNRNNRHLDDILYLKADTARVSLLHKPQHRYLASAKNCSKLGLRHVQHIAFTFRCCMSNLVARAYLAIHTSSRGT